MTDNKTPTITLDFKKQRIRIHKHTLHMMNDPEYIQLLVNPDKRTILIRVCGKKDFLSQKLKYRPQQEVELYSRDFLDELRSIASALDSEKVYRVSGSIRLDQELSVFNIDSSVPTPAMIGTHE